MPSMNKLEIAQELLKNTTYIYLREFIRSYIENMQTIENGQADVDEPLIRFDNCISYIEKVQFDIREWGLWEIPIFYSHCFRNEKTKQFFDLAVWDIGEVIPRYIDSRACEEDAKSIPEAIEKYFCNTRLSSEQIGSN